jgi:CheY-like chemotaxis protein
MAVILIVEDDEFIRDDAETMLQDWGHDIISASDVDEALSLPHLQKPHTRFQLQNSVEVLFAS